MSTTSSLKRGKPRTCYWCEHGRGNVFAGIVNPRLGLAAVKRGWAGQTDEVSLTLISCALQHPWGGQPGAAETCSDFTTGE